MNLEEALIKTLCEHNDVWISETNSYNPYYKTIEDIFKAKEPDLNIKKIYLINVEGWDVTSGLVEIDDGSIYKVSLEHESLLSDTKIPASVKYVASDLDSAVRRENIDYIQ